MIESWRKTAEIYHGAAMCREKVEKMLEEFSVPKCLFNNIDDLEEFGFSRGTGFYWLRRKSKTERKVDKVGATAYYDKEITGFIQHRRITKMTGVKAKELFLTLPVSEMLVGVPSPDKVKFVGSAGIYRVHPIAAFEPPA